MTDRQSWATPPELFRRISDRWGPFDLDAAASDADRKCDSYITAAGDALSRGWRARRVWLNPPYRMLGPWIDHAIEQVKAGNCERVVMLLPSRTDQGWFHALLAEPLARIEFLRGRIQFVAPPGVNSSSNREGSILAIIEEPI